MISDGSTGAFCSVLQNDGGIDATEAKGIAKGHTERGRRGGWANKTTIGGDGAQEIAIRVDKLLL